MLKKIFIFLLAFLFPLSAIAGTYGDSTATTNISVDYTKDSALIILDARKTLTAPQLPGAQPFKLAGIRVWNNASLIGPAVYESVDEAARPVDAPGKPTDLYQTHQFSGLSPNTQYYFKYYEYRRGAFSPVTGTYAANVVAYDAKVFQFKTELASSTTQQYSITLAQNGAGFKSTITAPTVTDDTLGLVIKTDDNGGGIGALVNETGAVQSTTIGKILPGSGNVLPYEIKNLLINKTYYVYLVRISSNNDKVIIAKTSGTTSDKENLYYAELIFDPTQVKNGFLVTGKIDTEKHPNYSSFTVKGFFANNANFVDAKEPIAQNAAGPRATPGISTEEVNKGSYYWTLPDLVAGQAYWFKQVITSPQGTKVEKVYPLIAGKGYVPVGSADEQERFEEKSYRLLAPFPGLSVLLDPDLCAEQVAAGKAIPDGQICDVNDFLNYAFRLLIGISAVILVIRLIFEGYQYAVTDVPFLKSSAKAKFFEAFFGLILALSAWLILNTINPRLVQNDIALENIEVALENIEGDSQAAIVGYQGYLSSGKPGNGITGYDFQKAVFPSGVICPAKNMGQGDIAAIAKSFVGKVTYAQLENPPKGPRGTPTNTGHFFLDCSSYVTTVLKCAGINPPSYAVTNQLFAGAEATNETGIKIENGKGYINNVELKIGDLIGWKDTDKVSCRNGRCSGHVVLYIGNGQVIDSHGGKGRNAGQSVTGPFSLEKYKKQIKWVRRM